VPGTVWSIATYRTFTAYQLTTSCAGLSEQREKRARPDASKEREIDTHHGRQRDERPVRRASATHLLLRRRACGGRSARAVRAASRALRQHALGHAREHVLDERAGDGRVVRDPLDRNPVSSTTRARSSWSASGFT
jgi:hypothetical protein